MHDQNSANLHLLLIGPYPPPFGGISSLFLSLVEGFKKKKLEKSYIVQFGEKNGIKEIEGAIIYQFKLKKHIGKLFYPKHWHLFINSVKIYSGKGFNLKDHIKTILKTILVNEVACLHKINVASFYQSDNSLELLLCKSLWGNKIGIALTVFGEIYDFASYILPRKEVFLELIKAADVVLSSSCHCALSFNQIGNKREIEVIYVGVSLERFSKNKELRNSYRAKLGISENNMCLLFMGRFDEEMGLNDLIENIPQLLNSEISFKIILAGAEGPLVEKAKRCESMYPDRVKVMNNIPFDLQPSLYAASDIVLVPSRDQHACMGVAIKEAMAASRPVIASDSGGIPEAVIPEETGVIVPLKANGENDLKNMKNSIISLSKDKNKRILLGNEARRRAEKLFSEETTISLYQEVFKRCISER